MDDVEARVNQQHGISAHLCCRRSCCGRVGDTEEAVGLLIRWSCSQNADVCVVVAPRCRLLVASSSSSAFSPRNKPGIIIIVVSQNGAAAMDDDALLRHSTALAR
jgi:hypothetical protein